MKRVLYPTLAEVLELHRVLIERFGGEAGVRDLGLLQSALVRPQTGYYESLSLQGAALLQSLILNHAFLDGNKRVGIATTLIFFRMNGYRMKIDTDEAESFLLDELIRKKVELGEVSRWIEKHLKEI